MHLASRRRVHSQAPAQASAQGSRDLVQRLPLATLSLQLLLVLARQQALLVCLGRHRLLAAVRAPSLAQPQPVMPRLALVGLALPKPRMSSLGVLAHQAANKVRPPPCTGCAFMLKHKPLTAGRASCSAAAVVDAPPGFGWAWHRQSQECYVWEWSYIRQQRRYGLYHEHRVCTHATLQHRRLTAAKA